MKRSLSVAITAVLLLLAWSPAQATASTTNVAAGLLPGTGTTGNLTNAAAMTDGDVGTSGTISSDGAAGNVFVLRWVFPDNTRVASFSLKFGAFGGGLTQVTLRLHDKNTGGYPYNLTTAQPNTTYSWTNSSFRNDTFDYVEVVQPAIQSGAGRTAEVFELTINGETLGPQSNLALNKYTGSLTAATDGNTGTAATHTGSGGVLELPTIDLGATYRITSTKILWQTSSGGAGLNSVFGSLDGTTWATPIAGATNNVTYGTDALARYIKVHGYYNVSTYPSGTVLVTEIYIYGESASAPAAPTNLTAASVTETTVSLQWSGSPGATSYTVYRDAQIIAAGLTGNTYVDAGLATHSQHNYYVTATNAYGESPSSNVLTVTTSYPPPLPAPGNLAGTSSPAGVNLTWSAVAGADHYTISRGGAVVATTANTSYTDIDVDPDMTYTYEVAAVDSYGQPGTPASVSVTTSPPPPPSTPSGLAATVSGHRVDLTWSAVPTATTYRLLRDGVYLVDVAAPATSYTDGPLPTGTYTYQVATIDAYNQASGLSSGVEATVEPVPAPSGLVATVAGADVSLTWSGSIFGGQYRIYRDGAAVATVAAPATSYTDGPLLAGTYTYQVAAIDADGYASGFSDPVSATVDDTTPPAAPTGLTAAPAEVGVSLAWQAPPDSDVAAYRIYANGNLVQTVPAPATSATVTALAPDTAYQFRVTAIDASGNESAPSNTATATTPAGPPAPTILAGTPKTGAAYLSWEPAAGAQWYDLRRGDTYLGRLPASAISYTDTNLPAGSYSYTLTPGNSYGAAAPASAMVSLSAGNMSFTVNLVDLGSRVGLTLNSLLLLLLVLLSLIIGLGLLAWAIRRAQEVR